MHAFAVATSFLSAAVAAGFALYSLKRSSRDFPHLFRILFVAAAVIQASIGIYLLAKG